MKKLNILIIRHANSCACSNTPECNQLSRVTQYSTKEVLNPQLSDFGLQQIQQALEAKNSHGTKLEKYLQSMKFVFCSEYMRAIETAKNLFPHRTIQVIPFVGEKSGSPWFIHLNLDRSNQPQPPDETLDRLQLMGYNTTNIDFSFYVSCTQGIVPFPNQKSFLKNIIRDCWMNPNSPYYLFKKAEKEVTIAVVSHSKYIKELLVDYCALNDNFWNTPSVYQSGYCRNISQQFSVTQPAIGNVGMFLFSVTDHQLAAAPVVKLDMPLRIYETNAGYDKNTQTCFPYNSKRGLLAGQADFVQRCPEKIRNIYNK